ncbi:hypothetical protein FOZ62_028784 [Perkinsus olseni]|uniref:Uncharacterized protein n=1 Tax=Perkinsus olseni TaxID=32597 RepID=A0A7J6PVC8_PEROL|nr:hypothetical protein FOZ62_028784 [Perkinsus olseni]
MAPKTKANQFVLGQWKPLRRVHACDVVCHSRSVHLPHQMPRVTYLLLCLLISLKYGNASCFGWFSKHDENGLLHEDDQVEDPPLETPNPDEQKQDEQKPGEPKPDVQQEPQEHHQQQHQEQQQEQHQDQHQDQHQIQHQDQHQDQRQDQPQEQVQQPVEQQLVEQHPVGQHREQQQQQQIHHAAPNQNLAELDDDSVDSGYASGGT